MGRPRTPTSVLKLRNGGKLRPCRDRPNEPQISGPLGPPPDRLDPDVLTFWYEIEEIAPKGVLGSSDRWAVELAALFMCKFTKGTASGAEMRALRSFLGSMGMTPADRAKLSIPQEKPANRFAALRAESERPN